jgi:malonyl-CoA O-methyltransferase
MDYLCHAGGLFFMKSLLRRIERKLIRTGLWRRDRPAVNEPGVRHAYRLWAPNYATETTTSFLDDELAQEMLRGLPQETLLDAGCGVGRRIANVPGAMGMDLSPEMLAAGKANNVVSGDVRAIPFPADRFDMVWSRLVLGHLPNPLAAYFEFARVCTPGGYVFVTDFHPDAVAAGHRRTFTDQTGTAHDIEHYVHTNHIDLARQAGLSIISHSDGVVGPSIRDFYLRGVGLKAYRRDRGLKLVAAFLFRKHK